MKFSQTNQPHEKISLLIICAFCISALCEWRYLLFWWNSDSPLLKWMNMESMSWMEVVKAMTVDKKWMQVYESWWEQPKWIKLEEKCWKWVKVDESHVIGGKWKYKYETVWKSADEELKLKLMKLINWSNSSWRFACYACLFLKHVCSIMGACQKAIRQVNVHTSLELANKSDSPKEG